MSLDKLLAEGLITTEQSFQFSSIRSSQPCRPPPCNATQKLLAQGLLIEEQLSPAPPKSKSRHHRRLSNASTLVPDDMERPSTSSPSKWYNSRRYAPSLVGQICRGQSAYMIVHFRLSFSSKSKKDKEASRYPNPDQLRQQAQSPQEIFESGLGKDFDLRRLGGLQTIRRAPKSGL